MASLLEQAWYRKPTWGWLLWPFECLFRIVSFIRRLLYRCHVMSSQHPGIPVIVVGNITVGGTGKTPVVIALCQRLQQQGWSPGILSRGYGGHTQYPARVSCNDPARFGDEPCLLAQRTGVPVVVDPLRPRGAQLLRALGCTIIVTDDGLQHYALQRDREVVIVDAERLLGNGHLLPVGPLREPPSRLRQASLVLLNHGCATDLAAANVALGSRLLATGMGDCNVYGFSLQAEGWITVRTARHADLEHGPEGRVHAVAGIGHPERFFASLRALGLEVIPHAFPDHHAFVAGDLAFGDGLPVVMTEKDAVKCRAFAGDHCWFLRIEAQLPEAVDKLLAQWRKNS